MAVAHSTAPYITIYNTANWSKLATPASPPTGTAYGVAWSPDGSKLAVAHVNVPRLTVYNTSNWSKMADPATAIGATGQCVTFSPNGNLLVVGLSAAPWVRVLNASNLSNASSSPSVPSSGGTNAVAFSPDGSSLAVGTETGSGLYVYRTSDWGDRGAPAISGSVNALAWTHNTELVIGSDGFPRLTILNTSNNTTQVRSSLGINVLGLAARKYTPMTISGTVIDSNNNPLVRQIRAYRRDTGELVGSATSSPSNGNYAISIRYNTEHSVVMFDDAAGAIENDQILRTNPV